MGNTRTGTRRPLCFDMSTYLRVFCGVYGCALGRYGVLDLREDSAPQPHGDHGRYTVRRDHSDTLSERWQG